LVLAVKRTSQYFRIGEVARVIGVSPSCLRNWESLGLFKADRTKGGYRLYSRDTITHLKRIQHLRKSTGVNIPGIQFHQERGAEGIPPLSSANFLPELPARLENLRRSRNLTLDEVSRKIGVSTDAVAAIEQGKALPFALLQKLSEVYETSVLSFFDTEGERGKLVRRKDRRILKSGPAVQMELLAVGATLMEPHLMRFAPRTNSGGCYRHQGEEFLYILQGKLEIWLDEIERYVLEPGDSLYFKSTQEHRWCTLTDSECLVLWINSPPTF
jgi:DNA-binding transcriptional MerR regulator/mannose-6-phosphate isomerase-like protein (cupin superfamily)